MHAIGILGHSADGAALCALEVVRASARRLGEHQHPEVTLSIRPMGTSLPLYAHGDLAGVRAELAETAGRLAAAGCAFFVCPDNTAHLALEAPGLPLPLPGLHICEELARAAARRGHRCIGLLGTRWTMEGNAYPEALARHGLDLRVPEPEDRALIDAVIFDELCQGVVRAESRARFVGIIASLAASGCDAVALGCTEIPLLVSPEDAPLPTLDSPRLLAHAAVDVALGERPLPSWRGGPFVDPEGP